MTRAGFSELEFDRLTERELEVLRCIMDGSSDEEIAEELYLSINTIKWHNRNIYAKLGVTSRTQALAAFLEAGLLKAPRSKTNRERTRTKDNLPAPVNAFIGREKEIQAVLDLLEKNRLLTLVGTAGVGKTRLALQIAARLAARGDIWDGVYFLELASVEVPEGVGDALVSSLNLVAGVESNPTEVLVNYLARKRILLLIDNFEHLLPAASLISELLGRLPDLKVLATSREALQLAGEQIYTVSPLILPDLDPEADGKALSRAESMELFIQRSKAANPDFSLTKMDLPIVARICTRLDGLPLALELAAVRMDFFNPKTMLKALDQRFAVLIKAPREADKRHQTLQKAIDWSYQLLSEQEQSLFNRLAVFQGGRTIDAVHKVCCQDLDLPVLDGLSSLYGKNLIQQEEGLDGEARFTMLESIHAFARDRLEESGEAWEMRERHALFFAELAEEAEDYIRGSPDSVYWLKHLKTEHANLRAAVQWSLEEGENVLGLRIIGTLDNYWEPSGTGKEIKGWLGEALEYCEDVPPRVRAKVFSLAGTIFFYAEEFQLSFRFYQDALAIFEELGEIGAVGVVLSKLISLSEENPAKYPQVQDYFNQANNYLMEVGDEAGLTYLYRMFGKYHEKLRNYTEAKTSYEKALEYAIKLGDRTHEAICLLLLGSIAYWECELSESYRLMQESLFLEFSQGNPASIPVGTLIGMAYPCEALGYPRRAAVLLAAGITNVYEYGHETRPQTKILVNEMKETLREKMGETIFQQAWDEGAALNPEEAISFALEEL